ncbi:MAG TPA: hypothetical protein VHA37_10135, partial [Candidatus Saccharimonadales bacterium]|nr:hypothetical protein [Candidatus Saccharimonadales bacterium]
MADQLSGSIDQWMQDEINAFFSTPQVGQTKRYRAYCKILVNGTDVTNRLDPYLLSVTVHNAGVWTAQIELDDRDGRLAIPPLESPLQIWLGWTSEQSYKQFDGFISDVEHGFGRRLGGRRMFITGSGWKQSSSVKSPINDHIGDGAPPGQMQGTPVPFLDAFQQFMGRAGMGVQLGASMQNIQRDYWSMVNESPMQWAARMAEEVGGWHRIESNTMVFNGPSDFNSIPLQAVWGNNLISWRVKPFAARPLWSGSSQDFFDHVKGMWGN